MVCFFVAWEFFGVRGLVVIVIGVFGGLAEGFRGVFFGGCSCAGFGEGGVVGGGVLFGRRGWVFGERSCGRVGRYGWRFGV